MSKLYKAVCPSCNSYNVPPIAYGLPGFEIQEEAIKVEDIKALSIKGN